MDHYFFGELYQERSGSVITSPSVNVNVNEVQKLEGTRRQSSPTAKRNFRFLLARVSNCIMDCSESNSRRVKCNGICSVRIRYQI